MHHFVSFSFLKVDDPTPFDIQAEMTLKTNFFATRNVCSELLPIVKPHGKSSFVDCQVASPRQGVTHPLGGVARGAGPQESPRGAISL